MAPVKKLEQQNNVTAKVKASMDLLTALSTPTVTPQYPRQEKGALDMVYKKRVTKGIKPGVEGIAIVKSESYK